MKVLLLVPPSREVTIRDYYCSKTSQANYLHPPIDLAVQGGWLRDRGHAVSLVDANNGRTVMTKRIEERAELIHDGRDAFGVLWDESDDWLDLGRRLGEIAVHNAGVSLTAPIASMTHDDNHACGFQGRGRRHRVMQHRGVANRMQHFRHGRTHSSALARRQDDDRHWAIRLIRSLHCRSIAVAPEEKKPVPGQKWFQFIAARLLSRWRDRRRDGCAARSSIWMGH